MSFLSSKTNSAINYTGYFDPIKPWFPNTNQPFQNSFIHPELRFAPPYGWDPKYKTDIMGSGRISGGRSYTRAALKGGRSYTRAALKGGKSYTRAALKGGRSYTRAALKGGAMDQALMNVLTHVGDQLWEALIKQAERLGANLIEMVQDPNNLQKLTNAGGSVLKKWFSSIFSRKKKQPAPRPTLPGQKAMAFLMDMKKNNPTAYLQIVEIMQNNRSARLLKELDKSQEVPDFDF